jgi:hypothetical protein
MEQGHMTTSAILRKAAAGAAVTAAAFAVSSVLGAPAWAGAPNSGPSDFGQVAAAPVEANTPINQIVGTVGAPLVNANLPCTAPWNQGGVLGADYNACNNASVYQQGGAMSGGGSDDASKGQPSDFGQVAAAPVQANAPINQIVGTVGAPLVNVNLPCTAPWQQGGVGGSHYNACNNAPVYQQGAPMVGGARH